MALVFVVACVLTGLPNVSYAQDTTAGEILPPSAPTEEPAPDLAEPSVAPEEPEQPAPTSEVSAEPGESIPPEAEASSPQPTVEAQTNEEALKAQAYEDPNEGVVYAEGRVLVVFENAANTAQAYAALETSGVSDEAGLADVQEIPSGDVVEVPLAEDVTVAQAVQILNDDPNVAWAQPDYIYRQEEEGPGYGQFYATNDPMTSQQWYLNSIGVNQAWDIARSNGSVKVAVIDSGIDMAHPDLAGNIDTQNAYDIVKNAALQEDLTGHGTHVAGIISAQANNGVGIAGISYNAKLVPINVFQYAYEDGKWDYVAYTSDVIRAIDYARGVSSVKVINMSMGGYRDDTLSHQAIIRAYNQGIVSVCAGGNDGVGQPTYPSDYEECISVIPTDSGNVRPGWANYNQYKDIAAPGVSIVSTVPGGYQQKNGSSMAAPVVSGVIALLYSYNPGLTIAQVKDVLYKTADDLGASGKDVFYGYGKINAQKALAYASLPTNVKAAGYPGGVKISWRSAAGWDKYIVYRSNTASGGYVQIGETDGNATSFMDKTAVAGNTYYYKLRGYLTSGNVYGSWTPDARAVAQQDPLPPAGLLINASGYNWVKLAWKPVAGAVGYEIYRSDNGGTFLKKGTSNTTDYTDMDVKTGASYSYKIRTVMSAGGETILSWYSSGVAVKPLPAVPWGLQAVGGKGHISISWKTPAGSSGYEVWRSPSGAGGSYVKVGSVDKGTAGTHVDAGVNAGAKYYYKLRAYRLIDGAAVYSGYTSAVSGSAAALPAPTGVKGNGSGYNWAKLKWNPVPGVNAYEVYRSDSYGAYVKVGSTTTPDYTDTGLITGNTYGYKVRSVVKVNGTSVLSWYSAGATMQAIVVAPQNVAASARGSYGNAIAWQVSPGATGYEVWRSATGNGGSYISIAEIGNGKTTEYVDTSALASGKKYYYKLRAFRTAGGKTVFSSFTSAATCVASMNVIMGTNNWLYMENRKIGDQPTNALLTEIKTAVQAADKKMQGKNIDFCLAIMPDKELVYPEYLPTALRPPNQSWGDTVSKYLNANTTSKIVYPRQELMSAKASNQVYYKYDSHWNGVGGFIGAQQICMQLLGNRTGLNDVKVLAGSNISGNLAKILGMQNVYNDDRVYTIGNYKDNIRVETVESSNSGQFIHTKSNAPVKKTLIVICDSFTTAMREYLSKEFSECYFIRRELIDRDVINLSNYRADAIVFETLERLADATITQTLPKITAQI